MTFLQAISDPRFSHCSVREWCGTYIVGAYFREPTSPSGVLRAMGARLDEVESLLRERGISYHYGPTRGAIAERQCGLSGAR